MLVVHNHTLVDIGTTQYGTGDSGVTWRQTWLHNCYLLQKIVTKVLSSLEHGNHDVT